MAEEEEEPDVGQVPPRVEATQAPPRLAGWWDRRRPYLRRVVLFVWMFALITLLVGLQEKAFGTLEALFGDVSDAMEFASRPSRWGWPVTVIGDLLMAAIWTLLAAVLAWLIYAQRRKVLHSSIAGSSVVTPCKALIFGLSKMGPGPREVVGKQLNAMYCLPIDLVAAEGRLLNERLDNPETPEGQKAQIRAFLGERGSGPNWQQNVRALYCHLDRLEHVVVLCSHDSIHDYPLFVDILKAILRRAERTDITIWQDESGPVDFEDLEALQEVMMRASRRAFLLAGKQEKDVCIDVTAGQKIFAIAGAVLTFNRDILFTYVNNAGRVRAFDASIQLGDFGS